MFNSSMGIEPVESIAMYKEIIFKKLKLLPFLVFTHFKVAVVVYIIIYDRIKNLIISFIVHDLVFGL